MVSLLVNNWAQSCAPDLYLVPTILFKAKKIENWKNADHFLSSQDPKFAKCGWAVE